MVTPNKPDSESLQGKRHNPWRRANAQPVGLNRPVAAGNQCSPKEQRVTAAATL